MLEANLPLLGPPTSLEKRDFQRGNGAKKSLTNMPKWCFFPTLKMKTAYVPMLKHAPANGRMSIWQRNCFGIGIVGINR
ncbi:MAG: hypothetical protein WBN22_03165 [Verrucomicrobiia bacterium]